VTWRHKGPIKGTTFTCFCLDGLLTTTRKASKHRQSKHTEPKGFKSSSWGLHRITNLWPTCACLSLSLCVCVCVCELWAGSFRGSPPPTNHPQPTWSLCLYLICRKWESYTRTAAAAAATTPTGPAWMALCWSWYNNMTSYSVPLLYTIIYLGFIIIITIWYHRGQRLDFHSSISHP